MAKKKANGEGSITYLSEKKLWQARISIHDPETGKIKRLSYYGKTKTEARDKLNKAQYEIQSGTFILPSSDKFGAWINIWLNQYKKGKLRDSTYALYENLIKDHILPSIGERSIQKLETRDIQRLINKIQEAGKSQSLIRQVHLLVNGAQGQKHPG